MYFITRVTRWDSTRDSDYRIAPLDKGYRDILLNTNRINKILPLDVVGSGFLYFDNYLGSNDSPGYIECETPLETVTAISDREFLAKTIQLEIHKDNNPRKPTHKKRILVDNLSYVDRYNPSPKTHCWIVYYEMAFVRRKVLSPYSMEEIADITSDWGDEQYLIYGDDFARWRKGVRDGDFVLDKTLTETGFTGIEDTDWENVKRITDEEEPEFVPFIITIDTTKAGSANDTFILPTTGAGYDAWVDWGDGTSDDYNAGDVAFHVYDYDDLEGTETERGWRQAMAIITPQTSEELTAVYFSSNYGDGNTIADAVSDVLGDYNYTNPIVDVKLSLPHCTSLVFGWDD
jgi:hypothetical protein